MYEVALEQSKYWKCINETMRDERDCKVLTSKQSFMLISSTADRIGSAAVIPISDILKAHRAYYLYYTCNLVNTELTNDKLQSLFEDQVFCSYVLLPS